MFIIIIKALVVAASPAVDWHYHTIKQNISLSSTAMFSFSWEAALKIFNTPSANRIQAALSKNQALRNQVDFLSSSILSSDSLPDISTWSKRINNQQMLQEIFDKLKGRIESVGENVELDEESKHYCNMVEKELADKDFQNEQARRAIEYARDNSVELQASLDRVKVVGKKPEKFTRKDVWFIQPETKRIFDERIARGDYSPWGHSKEEFEEGMRVKEIEH